MKCWSCGAAEDEPPLGKLSFRATCQSCGANLHCCRNCLYYKPGKPNDCDIPGTELISDRTAANFCEEFKLLGQGPTKTADPRAVAKRLFGDEDPEPKKGFDSLFKD